MPTPTTQIEQLASSETDPLKTNGLTEEGKKALMALAGSRKGDPSLDRLMEEVKRYRERIRHEEIRAQKREEQGK